MNPPTNVQLELAAALTDQTARWQTFGDDPMVLRDRKTTAGEIPDTGIPAAMTARMTMTEQYEWHQSFLRRHRVSRRNFMRGSANCGLPRSCHEIPRARGSSSITVQRLR